MARIAGVNIPTGKRVSACVAKVIADHHVASNKGLTQGVAASHAHSVKGGDGCC